ncbi:hypothetical protein EON80_16530 [bacterium]|nr:MAG: hypothetical protein EON80_16530 [bacterium]
MEFSDSTRQPYHPEELASKDIERVTNENIVDPLQLEVEILPRKLLRIKRPQLFLSPVKQGYSAGVVGSAGIGDRLGVSGASAGSGRGVGTGGGANSKILRSSSEIFGAFLSRTGGLTGRGVVFSSRFEGILT